MEIARATSRPNRSIITLAALQAETFSATSSASGPHRIAGRAPWLAYDDGAVQCCGPLSKGKSQGPGAAHFHVMDPRGWSQLPRVISDG